MNKRLIGTWAAAAVVAPALLLAASGTAAANGNVQWKNKGNGLCLMYAPGMVLTGSGCGKSAGNWYETKQSDGTFTLKIHGYCLDSNKAGKVYAIQCNGGNNQKWHETKTAGGWRLVNKATGLTLGSNGQHTVYTGIDAGGKYQRWS
ncbi:ricin-type beta-trefoil lectin domain protein [Streptomyces sp. NPDC059009]|uniref:RICIN domain-containing protein n=1 Tax=Streptomyces sp. NPDC059009 TaxID=3346694 RepID=UPI00369983BF